MQRPILRRFPYPYRAGLCITSDIDDTDTLDHHVAVRSLMLDEIGIPFTNTFLPFHAQNKFSLFSGNVSDKTAIIEDIKNGSIDAIHSFGEKIPFTRQDAVRTLAELQQNDCKLKVWIDHAESPSNLCKHRFSGKGDTPGLAEYHFDLTIRYGIRFVWTERLTNIIGQGVPLRLSSIRGIYNSRHPLSSFRNLVKTVGKLFLSFLGYEKYNFFKQNDLLRVTTLRDGQKIYEFIRFNNSPTGASVGDTFEDLRYLISSKVLQTLIRTEGYCIVYVHLGKKFDPDSHNGRLSVSALRQLKQEMASGSIYVDRVSDFLRYYLTTTFLAWQTQTSNGRCHIHISSVNDPIYGSYVPSLEDLHNITFYAPEDARLFLNGSEIAGVKNNPPDHTGRESISIK